MFRTLFIVSVLLLPAVAPAGTQTAKSNTPSPAEKQLMGKWQGTFQSAHGGGNMQLEVERKNEWKVTVSLQNDLHPIPDQQVSAFKVEGAKVTWASELMGGSCRTTAELIKERELKGETV